MISPEVLALLVDRKGLLVEVLHDGPDLLPGAARGASFIDLHVGTNRDKAAAFLVELQSSGLARDWELSPGDGKALFQVHGAVVGEAFVIAGERSPGLLVGLFEELIRANHSHAVTIGALIGALLSGHAATPLTSRLFDELTRLNSELATMERDLARQNAALQRENLLLGMVVHDLRTPIGVIDMSAMMIRVSGEATLTPAQRQHAERIERTARFMSALVGDLLDLSTVESGAFTLRRTRFDLAAEVRELTTCHQRAADLKSIRIVTAASAPLLCSGDAGRLRQVLSNLIDNAVKFSRPGSSVQVKCSRVGDLAHVAVIDHGLGIRESELHKLFKPLGRTSTCGTAGEPSTGLGLAIAWRIIEAHGGQLSVESKEGEGSTFRFVLPLG
jgi:two-component system, OmpR family, sensor kinase